MKIMLPEGFELPETARDGEPFDAVVTLKPGDDGSYIIEAVNGSPMPKENMEEEEEDPEAAAVVVADPEIVLPFEGPPM